MSDIEIVEGAEEIKTTSVSSKKSKTKEVKNEEIKNTDPVYNIDTFIEEDTYIREHKISGVAFKVWYTLTIKGSLHEKLSIKDWGKLFYSFLNSSTN